MTHDEFLESEEQWHSTQLKRMLYLEVKHDNLQVFQIIEEREKSFYVMLASRPSLYRGQDYFWLPKFFISNSVESNPDFLGILSLNYYFKDMWEPQMKVNLTLVYNV